MIKFNQEALYQYAARHGVSMKVAENRARKQYEKTQADNAKMLAKSQAAAKA